MTFLKENAGVMALVAIVIAILAFVHVNPSGSLFGTASTPGTSLVPTTLPGGSVPTLYSALEAGESFISDGPTWLMATTTESSATSAGTVSSPTYEVKGGIDYAYVQQSFTSTSSSVVIIPNPYFGSATTTILGVICQITSGTTGSNTFDLSTTTSTGGNSSSTPALVYGHSVASLAQDTMIWQPQRFASTTVPSNTLFTDRALIDGRSPFFLAPSEYLSYRIATGTPGTFATPYSGTCSASFMKQ